MGDVPGAWLAVLRAHGKKQGHRAITPQWCLLQTQGGSIMDMSLNKLWELVMDRDLPGALCSGTGSPALGLCSP